MSGPAHGSQVDEPNGPLVWIAASEAVPFAKTGGLADVTGALLRHLPSVGVRSALIMPLYRGIREQIPTVPTDHHLHVPLGGDIVSGRIVRGDFDGPPVYFVEMDRFFDRDGLYGFPGGGDHPDNADRFAFFSRAVCEFSVMTEDRPAVVHCHDWQTALIPFFLKTHYAGHSPPVTLFTIHNLGYQGIFGPESFRLLNADPAYFSMNGLEYYGNLSFLKAGILFGDAVSTVSPTYAREIMTPEFGHGMDGVLRTRAADLSGILNGLDFDLWDPSADRALPAPYSSDNPAGKRVCRRHLLEELGLSPNARGLVCAFVGRLAHQKGVDLIAESAEGLLELGATLVFLGDGDRGLLGRLYALAGGHPERIAIRSAFDESLARRIYAGADVFLMPSRYEPCGLGQLIALRYGTLPVVRRAGGLADTVREDGDRPNGFVFAGFAPENMLAAVARAAALKRRGRPWTERVRNAMEEDRTWTSAVMAYRALYSRLTGTREAGP